MKKRWMLFNIFWLISFVILLSYLMGIPLIGFAFLIVVGGFLWLLYRSRSEVPWLVWIIPYFLSVIIFLWLFNGGNFLNFVFHNFWFSLKIWLSYPFPFGFTIILAIVSYFVIYLASANVKRRFNSSITLAVTAAIVGIIAQFINPFVTLGMAVLFLFSIVLNSMYDSIIHKSILKMTGIILIAFLAIFLLTLTVRPISPLKNAFAAFPSNSVATPHASSSTVIVPMESVPISPGPTKNISSHFDMEWIYNILLYIIGTFSIAVSIISIYFFIKYREKRRKVNLKKIIVAIWMIVSILFVFVSVLYFIGISKPSATPSLNNHEPAQRSVTYLASITKTATPIKVTNYSIPPFFFFVVLLIVGAFIVIVIYNVFKYGIPIERKIEENDKKEDFEFKKENLNFSGPPDRAVLFYYNILRKKIGDPSLTPYEFEDYLKKYIGSDESEKMTEIFVKLRYAHKKITKEESKFFKEIVLSILNSH